MTKQLTPSGSSAIILAVLRSSLLKWQKEIYRYFGKLSIVVFILYKTQLVKIPLKCLFPKKVPFAQCPDVLFLRCVWLLYRYPNLTSAYYEECVASGTLSHYVIAVGVERLVILSMLIQ